jgi:uncharacterized protein YbcI
MTITADDGAGASAGTNPLLVISNAMVHLYKTAFGRGPTLARARYAGADMLVVVLQDTLTVSERRLVSLGQHERLREHRMALHDTVEDEMRSAVEAVLGRPTLALVSGIDARRDVAVETFLLGPSMPLG